ncbi:MAG: DNA polymerase IV [Candidatus Micrarchaeia archaeon]|jgi:DNA polymerase IV (DinB-like DNA polymerase)
MRIILLADMDYFYAACEELRNPSLKDKPVVVGADPKNGYGRGVVSTCNYIARKYGIKSGMPISMAYKLKSDAVFLPVDEEYYESVSSKIMLLLRGYAGKFEQVSIDEAFLDISNMVGSFEEAYEYAQKIKDAITANFGLPCSIGVGPNKLIAKMACEAAKPNKIKVVKSEEAKEFLAPLPLEKLYGVGKKSAEKLKEMGFKTIGDIANSNKQMLIDKFGSFGLEIYNYANAIDEDEVIETYEAKSIGREYTFEEDTDDSERLKRKILELASEVIKDVEKGGFYFRVVTIKLRYRDFEEHLHSKNLGHYIQDKEKLARIAIALFEKNSTGEKIRKIGLRVSNLIKSKGQKKLSEFIG